MKTNLMYKRDLLGTNMLQRRNTVPNKQKSAYSQ